MITVPADFTTKSASNFRTPKVAIWFDWDLTGNYQNESRQLKVVEVERTVNEPLGGVALAQADVTFVNINNRYTPRKDS